MKIILDQVDLEKAVHAHVTSLGVNLEGKEVEIEFSKPGRGVNANIATVDISASTAKPSESTPYKSETVEKTIDDITVDEDEVEEEEEEPADSVNVFAN
jgi:hypothetical protein